MMSSTSLMMVGLSVPAFDQGSYLALQGYSPVNNKFIQSLTGETNESYDGDVLGLSAYSSTAPSANGYVKDIHEYAYCEFVEASVDVDDSQAKVYNNAFSAKKKAAALTTIKAYAQSKKAKSSLKYILR